MSHRGQSVRSFLSKNWTTVTRIFVEPTFPQNVNVQPGVRRVALGLFIANDVERQEATLWRRQNSLTRLFPVNELSQ
jgi:hypothetical protein